MTTNAPTVYNAGTVGPKQTIQVALAGTFFYLTVASGPLFIKPTGGAWTQYFSGMGSPVPAGFALLQVYNPTANAVTFQLIAGGSEITDKRQILSTATPNVVKPVGLPGSGATTTWSAATGNAAVQLLDWSGKQFLDPSGTPWLAIARQAIWLQVLGEGAGNNANLILATGTSPAQNNTIVEILAVAEGDAILPPFELVASGNFNAFCDNVGGSGQVFVSVFEIYTAVAPNSLAYQPPN